MDVDGVAKQDFTVLPFGVSLLTPQCLGSRVTIAHVSDCDYDYNCVKRDREYECE